MSEHILHVDRADRPRVYTLSAITFLVPMGALMLSRALNAPNGIQLAVGSLVLFVTAAVAIRFLPKNEPQVDE